MEMDQLITFVTVAEQGSFSRAAQTLHITQPAVSKRIAALEAHFGVPLLDRLKKEIQLTDPGQLFLEHARDIVARMVAAQQAMEINRGETAGALRIATSHHIGLYRLPEVLREFIENYPAVRLDLQFMNSETACETVVNGEMDLAVVTLPLQQDPALESQPVWIDALVPTIGKDLARQKKRVSWAEFMQETPAILPAPGTFTRERINYALANYALPKRINLETHHLETLKTMVQVGLGWSVLPQTMIDRQLRVINLPGWKAQRQLGIVRHRGRFLSNAAKAFIDVLQSESNRKFSLKKS